MKSASTSSSFPGSGGRHEGCAGALTHDRWPRPLDLNGAIRMLDLRPATGGAFEGRKSAGLPTSGSETRRSGTREPCGRRVVPEGRPMRLSGQSPKVEHEETSPNLPYFCLASHEFVVPALSWCRGESPGSAIITADWSRLEQAPEKARSGLITRRSKVQILPPPPNVFTEVGDLRISAGSSVSQGPPELGEGASGLRCEPTKPKHLRPRQP